MEPVTGLKVDRYVIRLVKAVCKAYPEGLALFEFLETLLLYYFPASAIPTPSRCTRIWPMLNIIVGGISGNWSFIIWIT